MTTAVWVALITQLGALAVVVIPLYIKLRRVDKQTSNEHQDAEFPNLRVQQDEVLNVGRKTLDKLGIVEDAVTALRGITQGHDRQFQAIRRELADMHLTDETTDDTLERLPSRLQRRFEQRTVELIDLALTDHARSCPLHTVPSAASPG